MTNVTNHMRAHWADLALREFMDLTGCDRESAVGDLLANMMHWTTQNGFDFDQELDTGRMHFEAELDEARSDTDTTPAEIDRRSSELLIDALEGLLACDELNDPDWLRPGTDNAIADARAAIAKAKGGAA